MGGPPVIKDSETISDATSSVRGFWLQADAVMCACPDCGAPMSIRLWLMIADCWQCRTSVELTESEEEFVQHLLREEGRRNPHHSKRTIPLEPTPVDKLMPGTTIPRALPATGLEVWESERRVPLPGMSGMSGKRSSGEVGLSPSRPAAIPVPSSRGTRESARTTKPTSVQTAGPTLGQLHPMTRVRDWLRHVPAWLMSLLFHMALLALLALLMYESREEDPYITLSTEATRWKKSGAEVRLLHPDDPFHYDLPVPREAEPTDEKERQTLIKADQDARELRMDPQAKSAELPTLERVKLQIRAESPVRNLAARDPRVRVEVVAQEGGTTLTEASVARGLRWMAQHQLPDGRWSLDRFSKCRSCSGRCGGEGTLQSDSAATSLCLLPFLGAGQTHLSGIHRETVSRGLRWLIQNQGPDGDLRMDSTGNAAMYAHGQGAIVLCEAYAMTRDEQLREAAQKSIDFIVAAQHPQGGWRYQPGQLGDTSVLGWQVMALQSGRSAELNVPPETLELANYFLDTVQYDDGSRYAYQEGHHPTHVMTAEALLCRMYLGWTREFGSLEQGVRYLIKEHPPSVQDFNLYYWYYATQVMHHFGGRDWKRWNLKLRDILVESQSRRGHEAGSWDPRGDHSHEGGRLYATALAVCTLEVYYRHVPIFRQLELK